MKRTHLIQLIAVLAISFLFTACAPSSRSSTPATAAESGDKAAETTAAAATGAEAAADEADASKEAGSKAEAAKSGETIHLRAAASVTPHAEILREAAKLLKEEGIELEVLEFTDYVQPNRVTQDGEVDFNYFQHLPYLQQFNEENKTDLVNAAYVHYEPFGLYGGKARSLDEVREGSKVGIPNDVTNQARALQLLDSVGWIRLPKNADLSTTIMDIKENIKGIEIVELAAEQLPRSLEDLDYAIINGNYAMQVGLTVADNALATEKNDSQAARTFANIIVVRQGDESRPEIQKVVEALHSDSIANFVQDQYKGSVVLVDIPLH